MRADQKREGKAAGVSLALHLALFFIAVAIGLFSGPIQAERPPVDVVIYEEQETGGGASGDAAPAPAALPDPIAPTDIVLPDKDIQPVEQQLEREQRPQQTKQNATPSPVPAQDAGSGKGAGAAGGGSGTGTGSGTGEGIGSGAGSSDSGDGDGTGSGEDAGERLVPKTKPVLISAARPYYPPELETDGVEGTVTVQMLIGADGTIASVEILRSSGYGAFDEAAREAAYAYRFAPARNAYGEPVVCRTKPYNVIFHIND